MFDRKIQQQVLFGAIKAASDEETARRVVYGDGSPEENAAWVNGAMGRLESSFAPEAVKRIRMNCQCGYGMGEKLALVKELMENATSMEAFACQEKAKAVGLSYKDGELYLQFLFCPCPMLAEVERLESSAWCQCTTGYSKVLFEKAFGCEVDVELLKSVKMGDEICLMKIIPQGKVW